MWSFCSRARHPVTRLMEFHGYGFAPLVVLDGNHAGVCGAIFRMAFEAHAIVEFQRERRQKDAEFAAAKFQNGRFFELGTGTKHSYLHRNTNRRGIREKAGKLFGASRFLLDYLGIGRPFHVPLSASGHPRVCSTLVRHTYLPE